MRRLSGALVAIPIGLASALVILGVAVLLFLNPFWVGLEQDRAESGLLTGYGPAELHTATGGILWDLLVGPPDFDVEVNGEPVLSERERGHMRDVRSVFLGFFAVVLVAFMLLLLATVFARRSPAHWRRIARGARLLAVVVLVGGFVGLLFFDAAFEAFHQLFFASGSYTFDPFTDRLVQLFPSQFWVDTSIALGTSLVIFGFAISSWAGNRAKRLEAAALIPIESVSRAPMAAAEAATADAKAAEAAPAAEAKAPDAAPETADATAAEAESAMTAAPAAEPPAAEPPAPEPPAPEAPVPEAPVPSGGATAEDSGTMAEPAASEPAPRSPSEASP